MTQDETTKDQKGEPQNKPGQTSKEKGGTTSGKPDEATQKLISDKLTEQGRKHTAEREALTSQLKEARDLSESTQEQLRQVRREIREGKLDRNDPKAVSVFQQEEDLQESQEENKRLNISLKAQLAGVEEDRKAVADERIAVIADRYGVDPQELRGLGTTNRDSLIKYAKAITSNKEETPGAGETGKEGEKGEEDIDSNLQSGFVPKDLDLSEKQQDEISGSELAKRMKKVNPDLLT